LLHSAADIEGHKGTDGNFYLLDFSRVMPPCPPEPTIPASHLFQLFRPEFVKKYEEPLCSDAFSGFVLADPNRKEYNIKAGEAMQSLMEKNCVKFTRRFQWLLEVAAEKGEMESFSVVRLLHSHGINVRYLGVVLKQIRIKSDPMSTMARALLLCEIIARTIKNEINSLLRDTMMKIRLPMEASYRKAVVQYLNHVLVLTNNSYWRDTLQPLIKKYYRVEAPYTDSSFDILKFLDESKGFKGFKGLNHLVERIGELACLKLSSIAVTKIEKRETLELWDIEGFREKVKHMNIIADTTGKIQMLLGLQRQEQGEFASSIFYFQQAAEEYESALRSHPTNPSLLEHMALVFVCKIICAQIVKTGEEKGVVLRYGDWPKVSLPPDDNEVQTADSFFLRAMDVATENYGLKYLYGSFLALCGRFDRAEDYYIRSTRTKFDFLTVISYLDMLEQSNNTTYAQQVKSRLEKMTK